MTSRKVRATIAVFLLVPMYACFAGNADAGTVNGCKGSADNPHYSSGAGGIIAKARWTCTVNRTITFHLRMYVCPIPPTRTKQYIMDNCFLKAENADSFYARSSYGEYTQYVPPTGSAAHGSGYWVHENTWATAGDGETVISGVSDVSG